jgi:type IV secretory pathway VirB2 component (pilin)
MKQNESTTDRVIRAIVGVVLLGIGWFYLGNSALGIVLDVVGVVALFTAATGFCLLYKLFGDFSTKK